MYSSGEVNSVREEAVGKPRQRIFVRSEAASLNAQVTDVRPETSAIYALVRRSRSSGWWRSATVVSLSTRVTWV